MQGKHETRRKSKRAAIVETPASTFLERLVNYILAVLAPVAGVLHPQYSKVMACELSACMIGQLQYLFNE